MEIECPKCGETLNINYNKTCYTEESKVEYYYRTLKRISCYCSDCNLNWGFHLIGEGNPPKTNLCEDKGNV